MPGAHSLSQEKNHKKQLTEYLSKILARADVFQLPKDLPAALLTPGHRPAARKDCQAHPAHVARGPLHGAIWKQFSPVTWEVLGPLYVLRNEAHPNESKSTLQHGLRKQASCASWEPLRAARSSPGHEGSQPPKTNARKATEPHVRLRRVTRETAAREQGCVLQASSTSSHPGAEACQESRREAEGSG